MFHYFSDISETVHNTACTRVGGRGGRGRVGEGVEGGAVVGGKVLREGCGSVCVWMLLNYL